MSKYWFRPKSYGWGFVPVSWEGWLLTLAFVVLLLTAAYVNYIFSDFITLRDLLRYLLDVFYLTSTFSLVAAKKTDGRLRWRWGRRKK